MMHGRKNIKFLRTSICSLLLMLDDFYPRKLIIMFRHGIAEVMLTTCCDYCDCRLYELLRSYDC